MKKTHFNMMLMLVCMTLGLASIARAQIYSSEICFYITSDGPNKDYVEIIKFEGSRNRILQKYADKYHLKKILEESVDYFEDDRVWASSYRGRVGFSDSEAFIWDFDNVLSTSSKVVYKGISDSDYYRLYSIRTSDNDKQRMAFSKDMSSLIIFNLIHPEARQYYIRVDKEDLLPKAINPKELDFLNE